MTQIKKVEEPDLQYNKPVNFNQVWMLFLETEKQIKETNEQMKETNDRIKETSERVKETSEQMKETDKKMKENQEIVRRLSDLFTSQWGKLVEAMVEGELIRLLKGRGIKVESVIQRRKGNRNGENYEFDIIAVNTVEIVVVEVKTTLRQQDVVDFRKKLKKVKVFMPEYRHMKVYGAVAYISASGASERMAENKGLFVIRAAGNSASIINSEDFKPFIY